MAGLTPCLGNLDIEVGKYLAEKAKVFSDAGMSEKDAYIKAAKDLQEETLNQIHDIYHQLDLPGYEKPAVPTVSENIKNKFSQFKTKQNAVQEQSTGEVLQRQPGEVGETGGERERVEPGKQGEGLAGTQSAAEAPSEEEVKDTGAGEKEPVPISTVVGDKLSEELKNGIVPKSILDAEQRFEAGERIFAYHEMDEVPYEITSVEQLKNLSPDLLIAIPAAIAAATKAEAPPKPKPKKTKPKPQEPTEKPQEPAPTKAVKRKIRDEKLKNQIDTALDDLMGQSDILTSGGLDPKKIEKAVEIIGLYMKAGVYKFVDIIEDIYAKYGDKAESLFRAMKTAYLDYFASDATEEEAAQMDLNIRQHTFESIVSKVKEEEQPEEQPEEPEQQPDEQPPPNNRRNFVNQIKEKIRAGEKLNIVSIRKIATDIGLKNPRDTELQEMTELAIIELAREIVASSKTIKQKEDAIVALYQAQPTISMRSSERIALQQYSTPIPLAYAMGQFISDGNPEVTLEPSTGNGMLTIGLDPAGVIANEIDPVRLEMLAEQGFRMITSTDATQPFPFKVDAVIMNPPFGGGKAVDFDGVPISGLAKQMAANALLSLNNGGRAAIIIGGHTEYDDKGRVTGDRLFLNYLYKRYNVVDVINVEGSLYAKKGTSFPVRIILINGVKAEKEGFAPLEDKAMTTPVKSFAEIYQRVRDASKNAKNLNNENGQPNNLQPGVDANANDGDAVHGGSTATNQGQNQTTATGVHPNQAQLLDSTQQAGEGGAKPTDRGPANDIPGNGNIGERQPGAGNNANGTLDESAEDVPGGQTAEAGADEAAGDGTIRPGHTIPVSDRVINFLNEKVPYEPKSKSNSLGKVMPMQMATETYHTLDAIEEIYGDIDDFVQKELGYKTRADLFKALGAEQVDAVAIAIHQIKSGQGMVIGDMTGVGKGRIAASIIRYAVKNGHKPLFLSERANLFSDLHRDMVDTGNEHLIPFIVNDKDKNTNPDIVDQDGRVVHKTFSGKRKNAILRGNKLPAGYDFAVATYSQFRTKLSKPSIKRDWFLRASQGNILILDESHNASGKSNSSELFQILLPGTAGVVFLSATFAKQPNNMPIYAMKTAMSDANLSRDELVAAIERGGVALQEVIAANLVQSGQMIRREGSYDGVRIEYDTLEDFKDQHRETADGFTKVVRDIIDFEKRHVLPVIDLLATQVAAEHGGIAGQTHGVAAMGISNTPFASKTFNLINQMLFAIKAKQIAGKAIELHNEGKKPIIAFLSTMESFLDSMEVVTGERLEKADFALVLKRGLDGTMRFTVNDDQGGKTPGHLNVENLSPEGQKKYAEILKNIQAITSGIFISPIDTMIKELTDAGMRIGEITGRKRLLEIQDDGSAIVRDRKDRDINTTVFGFNNGDIDVVLLNASGAAGISMHSSPKFKDQRQRAFITGQLELDIAKEIQKRGRVMRTGQLSLPEYYYIVSSIPAEQRLLMMFKTKLSSLDANTTSSQKSKASLEMDDFLNKYGDEVVTQYVKENAEFNERIEDPLNLASLTENQLAELRSVYKAANKITGRVAILPTEQQEAFYRDIIAAYISHMNYLNKNNENDLEVKMMPLRAKTIAKVEIIAGKGTNSPFGMASIRETVEVDILTKPMKKAEVDEEIEKYLDGKTPRQAKEELLKELEEYEAKFVADKIQKIQDKYDIEIIPDAQERNIKKGKPREEIDQIIADLVAKKEDRIAREQAKYDNLFNQVSRYIRSFSAGDVYAVPTSTVIDVNINFSKGVFLGFHIKETATNKFTPSNIEVRFAVLDSRRVVPVPLTKVSFLNAMLVNTQYINDKLDVREDWDARISQKTRATRYIITGNLLQAYGTNKTGQLVAYTTDTGRVQKGILLPDTYDPAEQKFRTKISKAFDDSDFDPENNYRVTRKVISTDGDVTIEIYRGEFTIAVPLSKQRGGKYFLNPEIRNLVVGQNFQQRAGMMEAPVNLDNIRALLVVLDGMGVSVDTEMGGSTSSGSQRNYQMKEAESPEMANMKELVGELIEEGYSKKKIQELVAKELGEDQRELAGRAYNEATKGVKIAETNAAKEPQKNELSTLIFQQLNNFLNRIFGKGTDNVEVLKDTQAFWDKADELNAVSDVQILFSILDDINVFTSNDEKAAKDFITKVFRTVDNLADAKVAYRKLAMKYHPDKNPTPKATEIFKHLNNTNEKFIKDFGRTGGFGQSGGGRRPGGRNPFEDFYDQYTSSDFYEQQSAEDKARQEAFEKERKEKAERVDAWDKKRKAEQTIFENQQRADKEAFLAESDRIIKMKNDYHNAFFKKQKDESTAFWTKQRKESDEHIAAGYGQIAEANTAFYKKQQDEMDAFVKKQKDEMDAFQKQNVADQQRARDRSKAFFDKRDRESTEFQRKRAKETQDFYKNNYQFQFMFREAIIGAVAMLQPMTLKEARVARIEQVSKQLLSKDERAVVKILNDYYKENDETPPKEVIDRALYLWDKFGRPEIVGDSTAKNERAFSDDDGRQITISNITDFDDFVAELSHAAQYVSGKELDDRKYATEAERDRFEYNRKGSTEYNAHKIIEPILADYIFTGDSSRLNKIAYQETGGEILGFTHNGKIYLNGEYLNPNTPVHEGAHVWTEWVKENDPVLYARGIELINKSDYLERVKKQQFYKNEANKLPEDQREAYYQHEALAAAIGDKGAQFITEAKRKSWKEWAKNLWDKIGQALGFKNVTAEQLQNMTFDEFMKRAAVDILKGEPSATTKTRKVEPEDITDEQEADQVVTDMLQDWEISFKDKKIIQDVADTDEKILNDQVDREEYLRLKIDLLESQTSMQRIVRKARQIYDDLYVQKLMDIADRTNLSLAAKRNLATRLKEETSRGNRFIFDKVTMWAKEFATQTTAAMNFGRVMNGMRGTGGPLGSQSKFAEEAMGDMGAEMNEGQQTVNEAYREETDDETLAGEGREADLAEEIEALKQQLKDMEEAKEKAKEEEKTKPKSKAKGKYSPVDYAEKASAAENRMGSEDKNSIIQKIKDIIKKC